METNLFVYIINHNTITGYKTKTTSVLLVCKIHHKLSYGQWSEQCLSTIKACLNPPEQAVSLIDHAHAHARSRHTHTPIYIILFSIFSVIFKSLYKRGQPMGFPARHCSHPSPLAQVDIDVTRVLKPLCLHTGLVCKQTIH